MHFSCHIVVFKNVGCYQKLCFLTFAGGVKDVDRTMTTNVYYSTGEPDVHTFEFLDCASVKPEKRAYITQIYSSGFVKGSPYRRLHLPEYPFAVVRPHDLSMDLMICPLRLTP